MSTRKRALAGAAAAAAVLCSLPALAADNGNVTVTATVQGICKLTATPAMSWGSPGIDPTGNTDAIATSTVKYRCTKGTSAGTFSVGTSTTGTYNGTLTGALPSPDTMAYQITWSTNYSGFSGAGFAPAAAEGSVVLTGTITSAAYSVVKADTYSQTVAVSITP
jgi:hypothetical protein